MKKLIVIPSRYQSSRFPGKPLSLIETKSGDKITLVEMTWRTAKKLEFDYRIVVATDDSRIEEECNRFGAEVIITPKSCANGTERVAETVKILNENFDVIINLQGDSPLLPTQYISLLAKAMKNKLIKVATPIIQIDSSMYSTVNKDRETNLVGPTFVVCKKNLNALYFSKAIIPSNFSKNDKNPNKFYFHVGLYAYTQDILERYTEMDEGALEKQEGLEQLRFLENDIDVRCVVVEAKGSPVWEVNNPSDIAIVEKIQKSGRF